MSSTAEAIAIGARGESEVWARALREAPEWEPVFSPLAPGVFADGSKSLHQLGAAAERSRGEAAADDLAEDRQVGRDAETLLRTAAADAEAGDHLVEDEQRTACVAQRTQRPEKAGPRRDAAHVPRDRFDDDRRKPFAIFFEGRRDPVNVVVVDDDRVRSDAARHPG